MGKGVIRKKGQQVAILNFGTLLPAALTAAEDIDATVVDMRFVKPLDEMLISELAGDHALLVTLEENSIQGGAGAAVSEYLASQGITMPVMHLGLPDLFVEQGNHEEQLAAVGLDAAGIGEAIKSRLESLSPGHAKISRTGRVVSTGL